MGIDIGTSGSKAAVFNRDGRCLSLVCREYSAIHSGTGRAELDSRQVWTVVKEIIAEAAGKAEGNHISAISISSIGEAVVPVTRKGEILDNSILSSDIRGEEHIQKLLSVIDKEKLYRINGNIAGVNYTLPKLCWLQEHRPELFDKAGYFLLWSDFIAYMLSGETATSPSLAGRTLLYDLERGCWSDEILAVAGLPREKLPPVRKSGTLLGKVKRGIALELGLSPETKVVVGGHDQCCNALGAGCTIPGRAALGLGTYECLTPVYQEIPEAGAMMAGGLNVEEHVLEGQYVTFFYNQSGSLIRWYRDTFAAADKERHGERIYEVLAEEMPEGPIKLFTLPCFETTGPPDFIDDAGGAILGLSIGTSRGEILKSIMESVTFYFIKGIAALKEAGIIVDRITATGGGAKSDAWLQMKADIYGLPLSRPAFAEATALGAALLCVTEEGLFASSREAADNWIKTERVFQPDAGRHQVYREKTALFDRILSQALPCLKEIGS